MQTTNGILPVLRRCLGVALILFGSACAAATPTASDQPIAVTLNSFSLTPSATSAPAGSVTFNVTNAAAADVHEFVIVQTDLAADQLPVAADNTVDEAAVTVVDEIEDIAPSGTGTLTVDLAAGHYVLICNVAAHYSQGMHSDFTVNP
jgi:uncharacterized cupredoxin-like copper-binding protein